VTIGPDTLSGGSITNNFLNVTGTLPATTTTTARGISVNITSAGSSSFAQQGGNFSLLPGYTGSIATTGFAFSNTTIPAKYGIPLNGTSRTGLSGNASGTYAGSIAAHTQSSGIGIIGTASGYSTTDDWPSNGVADNAPAANIGVVGQAISSAQNAFNYGTVGWAKNSGTGGYSVGGMFGVSKFGNEFGFYPKSVALEALVPKDGSNDPLTATPDLFIAGQYSSGISYAGSIELFRIDYYGNTIIAPKAQTSGSPSLLALAAPAQTGLTASTEAPDVNFGLNHSVQFSTGALTTQRAFLIQAPTYSFVGASTLTNAATLAITAAPTAGTNATITNTYALWVQGGNSVFAGNVGIGNTAPAYKLDVAGDINTTGDIRKSGTAYTNPDYVFEPGYEMRSLGDLRSYTQENHHLPGVPSSQEVQKSGVALFEQTRLNLEKTEQAYLYIFGLSDQLTALTGQLTDMQQLLGLGTTPTPGISLTTAQLKSLVLKGDLAVHGDATFLGDVDVQGVLTRSNEQAGYAVIPKDGNEVVVVFPTPFLKKPIINVTPSKVGTDWEVTEDSETGFTIRLAHNAAVDTRFSWLAISVADPKTTHGKVAGDTDVVEPTATPSPSPTETPTPEPSASDEPTPSTTPTPSVTPSPPPTETPTPTPDETLP
jgi:hypothetical protein